VNNAEKWVGVILQWCNVAMMIALKGVVIYWLLSVNEEAVESLITTIMSIWWMI
jgi:hypothetical protein